MITVINSTTLRSRLGYSTNGTIGKLTSDIFYSYGTQGC